MTHEERNNLVAIVVGLFIMFYLGSRVWLKYEAGEFDGPDGLMIWARTVLWVIPIGIGLMIIATILTSIVHAIVTKTPNPSFIVDERDRHIGRYGTIVTMSLSGAGLILAMVFLAIGWSPLAAMNTIFFSYAASDLIGNLVKLILWRRGL